MDKRPDSGKLAALGDTDASVIAVATKKGFSKKGLALTGISALILAALVVGGYVLWQNRHSNTAVKPPTPSTPQMKYKAVDTSLKSQFDTGDYRKTVETINTYLATDPPKEYVKQVTIQQAAAYLNLKDYPNALIWYNKALELSSTPFEKMAALHGLAFTYERSGDKTAAIEQYKAAYAIAKPMSATDNQSFRLATQDERKIKLLGGTL